MRRKAIAVKKTTEAPPLLELLEKGTVFAVRVFVYEHGGDGPEGIAQHYYSHGDVPGETAKLRALADYLDGHPGN